jgi:molecular chaperone GrpE
MADQHDTPVEQDEAVAPEATASDSPVPEAAADAAAAADGVTGNREPTGPESPSPPAAEEPEVAPAEPEPDWQDKYLRAVAELDNVRKRARRDVAVAEARGIAKLAKELLPAIDDLDRALAHAEAQEQDADHHLTAGIRAVQQQLLQALARIGISTDSPKGEKFDPHRHEALTSQPAEGVEPGVVLEVFQPGYVYADTVLRAAKVVVSA